MKDDGYLQTDDKQTAMR